jgi:hypothetical protein
LHINTLERINSVGMAMRVLDSIKTESNQSKEKLEAEKLKNITKAEVVKMILSHPVSTPDIEVDNTKNQ